MTSDKLYLFLNKQANKLRKVSAPCCRGKRASSSVPVELNLGKLQFHPQLWLSAGLEHQSKTAQPSTQRKGKKEEKENMKG